MQGRARNNRTPLLKMQCSGHTAECLKRGLGRQGAILAEHFGRRRDNATSRDFYLQVEICRPCVIILWSVTRFELIVIIDSRKSAKKLRKKVHIVGGVITI